MPKQTQFPIEFQFRWHQFSHVKSFDTSSNTFQLFWLSILVCLCVCMCVTKHLYLNTLPYSSQTKALKVDLFLCVNTSQHSKTRKQQNTQQQTKIKSNIKQTRNVSIKYIDTRKRWTYLVSQQQNKYKIYIILFIEIPKPYTTLQQLYK